ncbi:autophagy-related protein 2 isoform X2 [Malania oleifera]|uniref:autophagy-related protein 2 isoform X2 n=1 Tax=Malania oleifera TaxID=397392 RepID=UPI0025ADF143|nr:autophagy-related protein 2 isoform X2 [Malania oleifera]
MWSIARSAEAMFSRWAVKRVCKFFLKKKLGQFILGDIDLDQLDVQLGAGTIQLSDLALNVDYINQKFGTSSAVIMKEGSIGYLLAKMPWNGKGCQIEVDELEVVLAPRVGKKSHVEAESSRQGGNCCISHELGALEHEMDHATTSASVDVHEGVKTIAKLVKWLLTSFHVKIKRLIVALDPCLENDEKKTKSHMTLVLRITETECGTCISEDVISDEKVENFLGISRLTNFVKFRGAILELLQMDGTVNKTFLPNPSASGSTFGEWLSECCPLATSIPILSGEHDGFSGTLKLSIPWRNGSLDVCKVDSEVYIDPVELKLQPRTIKWLLLVYESLKTVGSDGTCHTHYSTMDSVYYNSASHFHSSTSGSSVIATDKVLPDSGSSSVDLSSPRALGTGTSTLLPGSNLIIDWVPFSDKIQKDKAEEGDFGASLDQFFECFDEMRSSQSALGSSGIWNWTSSVFSAITAASSLASGSLHITSEQQHVQTNFKATVAGVSVVLTFDDGNMKQSYVQEGDQIHFGSNFRFLGAKCQDIILVLQVCPQEMKVEALVKHIELADHFNNGNEGLDFGLSGINSGFHNTTSLVQHLQAEIQGALPPFASFTEDSSLVNSKGLAVPDLPSGLTSTVDCMSKTDCESIKKDSLVKVKLLTAPGVSCLRCSVNSSSSNGISTGSISFSLELPPFVLWVNLNLVNMLLDLLKDIGSSSEMINSCDGFASEASNVKHPSSCHGNGKRDSQTCITNSSSKERLRGNINLPNARVILCFPFKNGRNFRSYSAWDHFIAFNLSSPFTLSEKKVQGLSPISDVTSQKRYSLRAFRSLHLNVGNLDLFLVSANRKDDGESNFCALQGRKFSAHNILSVANETGASSLISMIWQESPVLEPLLAKKAKDIAASGNLSRNKVTGKGYEFASVATVKDVEDSKFCLRKEMIQGSEFFLHVHLPPVTVNFDSSQCKQLYGLINQFIDGLCVPSNPLNTVEDSVVSQTSFLVESDSVQILIYPDLAKDIKGSLQNELPGLWYCLKLKIQKFELLSVSNIGGIMGANFLWVGHGEGKLWGLITGVPDKELLLISCSNSTMRRGDGGGSNALSYGHAGSDIIHLWDPESSNISTSVTVRCGTIVAIGGRLDWLDTISSFFSSVSAESDQVNDSNLQKRDSEESAIFGASFVLNLVDVGLSYEPYLRHLSFSGEVSDSNSSSDVQEEMDRHVACLLAASSLNLSNLAMADSTGNDYRIGVQDLGLLLSVVFRPENVFVGSYSVENLQKNGYVKVAGEAFVGATLRTNCVNGLLWELECSESLTHFVLDTCHDTTSGLIRLVAQLQQLFAPDVEESIVHLQARWNNVQQAQEKNNLNDEGRVSNCGSSPSASHASTSTGYTENKPVVFGLMDEICENAFYCDGDQIPASDSCESECISLDGRVLGEACNVSTRAEVFSQSSQTSFLETGCIPEIIESYYRPELCLPLSTTNKLSDEVFKFKSNTVQSRDVRRENSGWYGDTSLRIVENHISEVREPNGVKQFVEGKLSSEDCIKPEDFQRARGRVLLKNINVRWRMYAGSDWLDLGKMQAASIHGRDTTVCLELALFGMNLQYDIFPEDQISVSKISLSVKDVHLYDNSKDAPWKLVLGYYDSKEHPRESSSKAFKLDLEAIRPDPLTPLEEYRLRVAFLPMLLHLHQVQLDFLIDFFGGKNSAVQSSSLPQDFGGSKMSQTKCSNFGHTITDEALLPYFQKFDICPILIRIDYTPSHVDLAALRGGKYVELVNLVPWKGIELQLKHVHAVGVYGWGSIFETIVGEWLEDISQNQIHKLLQGLPTIRSLVAVSSGAAKLVSLPVKSYRKDRRLLKGMQRGTIAFLRSISLEAVGLGLHLAAGAHDILLQAECILASIPPTVSWPVTSRIKTDVRYNQPKDAQQGLQQACESLSDGLGRSASALVQAPLKSYQRGAGAGSALATAVRAAPAAAIAPASAAAGAVHFALLGVRNSLDPEHKRESIEKYLGPAQPWEQS